MPSAQPADRGGIAHPAVYREWMGLALDAAARTDASADVPIGAVVIDAAGTIIGIGCNHKKQQGVAFDMAKKTQSQTFTLAGTFYYSRNIGHYKRFIIAVSNNPDLRFECRKRIVRYLRFRCTHNRQQGRFSGIRETDKPDIGYAMIFPSMTVAVTIWPFIPNRM